MDDMSSHYQVLEELGSELLSAFFFFFLFFQLHFRRLTVFPPFAGGSFGVVYKAIDKTDGEIVAIKHVRFPLPILVCRFSSVPPIIDLPFRLISSRARMIFRRFSRKFPFWLPVQAPLLHSTKLVSSRAINYGLSWNTSGVVLVWTW